MGYEIPMRMPVGTARFTSIISAAGPRPTVQGNGRECRRIRVSNSNGSRVRSDNPGRMNFSGGARRRESQEPGFLPGEVLLHPDLPLRRAGECAARERVWRGFVNCCVDEPAVDVHQYTRVVLKKSRLESFFMAILSDAKTGAVLGRS